MINMYQWNLIKSQIYFFLIQSQQVLNQITEMFNNLSIQKVLIQQLLDKDRNSYFNIALLLFDLYKINTQYSQKFIIPMPISKQNIIDDFYQQVTQNQYEYKHSSKFCDIIDDLFTDLQKLMQNVKQFKRDHSNVIKQYSYKVQSSVTTNYFQMKLISITEYIQFQNDLDSTLSMIHSLLQQFKNGMHSQKDTQHKSITDLISKIDFLSGLIQKCQKTISSEKTRNDIEDQSKTKSIQHLSQILKTLEGCKTHLLRFQQSLKKDEQIKMDKNDQMTQNQKQKNHKTMNIINQEILKNISQTMSSLKTPKQTRNVSFNSLYYKYQVQNLQFYKNFQQNVEFMLKQTENRNESEESFQSMRNHYDFMVDKIIDSLNKINELETYKYKSTISSSQFESHFGQIMGELLTVKQNLQKQWTQKINQQEVSAILRSTQEINQNLQKTLIKYQGYKNGQKTSVSVPLKDLHEINDKNISIKQNIMKILTIIKNQQKKLKKRNENVLDLGQNQHNSEDQGTTTIQCFYSQQQMEQEIKQRLNKQTIKMKNTHQKDIENLNNELKRMKNDFQMELTKLIRQIENHLKQKINFEQQIKKLKEQHANKINNLYDQIQKKSFEAAKEYREKEKKLQQQLQQKQKIIQTLKKQSKQINNQINQQQNNVLGSWIQ